jgi:[protein-PII] uridylyltransferase
MSAHLKTFEAHVHKALGEARADDFNAAERLDHYKRFIKIEEHRIKLRHGAGAGGLEIARARAELIDAVLESIFQTAFEKRSAPAAMTLLATGGYGRGTLNPASDIDLLFLVPQSSHDLPKDLGEIIQEVLYLLWDVGFKVGHACRSIAECLQQAKTDQEAKTAMMDARRVTGDEALFETWRERFEREAVNRGKRAFIDRRRQDLLGRHEKYSRTVFLQEPHVKEGCGGLRDYQNIFWMARVNLGVTDGKGLIKAGLFTPTSLREIDEAYDFLHRVRNELHYQAERGSDQLTLRLQGVVASAFRYPQRSILRRTEAFMKDYYFHTRNLYRHTTSLMETFQIEKEDEASTGLVSFLTFRKNKSETFDGFVAREGRILPAHERIFEEDPHRLMRLFRATQQRHLRLSPPMRILVKNHWNSIDRAFRYAKANRETFEAILSHKGDVGRTLRQMHRVGFLGRYLPEFGALDCLVQHEFFHRYTADEHTLRFIEHIDALLEVSDRHLEFYRRLLIDISDPYGLYLAIVLHDTGRSENVREHIDGSAVLAQKLCNRLQVSGPRRQLIMFLVDHHLTFWRYATSRNIEDLDVIAEFAGLMKTPERLDALLLFTYGDSKATSRESWTSWKETLMRQLHAATHRYLAKGREQFNAEIREHKQALEEQVHKLLRPKYHADLRHHFERMPASYFRFRDPKSVPAHVKTVHHFLRREAESDGGFSCSAHVSDFPGRGYSELVIASRDQPALLEKICCAIAAQNINIISADFHTRTDGIVVNIFRVCTVDFEPVSDPRVRERILEVLRELGNAREYDPSKYLKPPKNLLRPRQNPGFTFPVRVTVSNDLHPNSTAVEVQAVDRIGLLHDLLHEINAVGLDTVHARICTEKGAAIDTLYVTRPGGGRATDQDQLDLLGDRLSEVIRAPSASCAS